MTTYAELQAQIKKLQEQAEEIRSAELETVIADIKKKISEYGLTAEQLGFSSATGKTPKNAATKESTVMYKKGDQTWSGATRGRKPDWVKEILEAGGDIEQYRVK
jgi:DNA-binding protein H-NS